ncbi:MAG TPA: hypothetical protein VF746_15380 [Longimicrobium sp.]|jgi:hypothetical protein
MQEDPSFRETPRGTQPEAPRGWGSPEAPHAPPLGTPWGQPLQGPYGARQPFAPRPDLVSRDLEHLRLLSIFHYVLAGITALFACFPLIHVAFGVGMLLSPDVFADGDPAAGFMGWMFLVMGGAFVLGGWAMAFATFKAGQYLKRRERHTFCMVVAALMCLNVPLGTVLGVFTLVTLTRDSVRALFPGPARPAA